MTISSDLDRAVAALPRAYPGPGGAVAVLRAGEVLVRHAWGWANAEQRRPFTPNTLFRMCSITKQFTCALLLDTFPDPSVLDADVRQHLPRLTQQPPTALHLCHNQSGLRDYWAIAMLLGSPPEAPFGDSDAARIFATSQTLQFAPGTRYSYVNQNFRILSDILQDRTGRSFAELLRTHIFDRVGMDSALLAADTRAMPDGAEGYEGTQSRGFRAARNRILWTGDAGLGASLDDMIAWERHIDATRDDPGAIYSRLSAPVEFTDGNPAFYGFGLSRSTEFGRALTGHGGALRGWRSHRLYVPSERISVVVMFNHLADAHDAAIDLLAAVLGEATPKPTPHASASDVPDAPDWLGAYVEPETGLSARIEAVGEAQVRLRFGHHPELLDLAPGGTTEAVGATRLRREADGLWMDRPQENQTSRLVPCPAVPSRDPTHAPSHVSTHAPSRDPTHAPSRDPTHAPSRDPTHAPSRDVAGRYRCAELDAELTVEDAGGALYGAFSGPLGQSRMELLDPIGPDLWALPCPCALDHTPPGDWTLAFRRDTGRATSVEVGCWLARRLSYDRC